MKDPGLIHEAQLLLKSARQAVLSTNSVQHAGYPFGSITPYALDPAGRPLLLISALAVHTRNLQQDARCSLLILEPSAQGDPQAAGRLTLLGKCLPLDEGARAAGKDAYLARHPDAEQLFGMKDFALYGLHVEHARFVAGFGRMGWLTGEELRAGPASGLAQD